LVEVILLLDRLSLTALIGLLLVVLSGLWLVAALAGRLPTALACRPVMALAGLPLMELAWLAVMALMGLSLPWFPVCWWRTCATSCPNIMALPGLGCALHGRMRSASVLLQKQKRWLNP
jgi:hypothetical protein